MYGIGTVMTLLSGAFLAGCAGQTDDAVAQGNQGSQDAKMINRQKPSDGPSGGARPHRGLATTADPRDFDSLDDYLAQLEWLGGTGQAWYRQVGPDAYEYVTTMVPAPPPRTFTRAELMTRFGFTR